MIHKTPPNNNVQKMKVQNKKTFDGSSKESSRQAYLESLLRQLVGLLSSPCRLLQVMPVAFGTHARVQR